MSFIFQKWKTFLTSHDRKQTALMYAAFNGHLDVVTLLVKHGADISATNECVTNLTLHIH
jgi:ankyrin repeat protein